MNSLSGFNPCPINLTNTGSNSGTSNTNTGSNSVAANLNLPVPTPSPGTPNINLALATGHDALASRLANQNERIAQGVQNGSINKQEAGDIWGQRKELGQTLTNDLRGDVPFQGQFKQMLNDSSKDIHQDKHNDKLPVPGFKPGTPNINLALETGHDGIAARLANQNRDIAQGTQNGTLNNQEQNAIWSQRKAFGQTLTNDLRADKPFQGQFNQMLNASRTDVNQYKNNA